MNRRLRDRVRQRAKEACEYCKLPEVLYRARFPIDHILAEQHGGLTEFSNLALACLRCNSAKGPNLSSRDARTRRIVRLFHPRKDKWIDHFRWDGSLLVGRTAIGRATITLLRINHPNAIAVREELIAEGAFPPA